jgi:hypothetical protein
MTSRQVIIRFVPCVAGSMVWLTSCRPSSRRCRGQGADGPRTGGRPAQILGVIFDLPAHEVLAGDVATHENGERLEIALVWGRTTNDLAPARWRSSRVPGAQAATTRGIEVSSIESSGRSSPTFDQAKGGTERGMFQMYEHAQIKT